MISSSVNALGIIFPNSYDSMVTPLVTKRVMASIPFASRYRMIDFLLSSMVNSGIGNVSVLVRKNYHSLMDHLGNGREWDLSRKNGGLNIVPPFAEKTVKVYNGRVEALTSILHFLKAQKEEYVVMADSNIAVNFDFEKMIQEHIESKADLSIAYIERDLPSVWPAETSVEANSCYYTLRIGEDNRVTEMHINPRDIGMQNLSLNIYVMSREKLIQQIEDAAVRGVIFFERDVIMPNLNKLNVHGFKFEGYVSLINSLKAYFDENMALLKPENAQALFAGNPFYTKIRDDNPTRYTNDSNVHNVMAADGCVIEGTVENCVLFRGVHIAKGAVVKNCILMQDTYVGENAKIQYMITDKNVTITQNQEMNGTSSFPVYIEKRQTV